ncbi:MAG: DUF3798 domain-containing protein [Deltaproteobacteria bacterium]|jgi:hypothetical protein|nr:DUF3798 domain-containing protein [Deltaproteobacteria bacterium]
MSKVGNSPKKKILIFLAALVLLAAAILFRSKPAEVPAPEPAPVREVRVLGVVTGDALAAPEENAALEIFLKRTEYIGGFAVKVARFGEDLSVGDAVMDLAADPAVRAILVAPAATGTSGAFLEARKARPELILLAADAEDDPGPLAMAADLVVSNDFVSQGARMVQTAWAMHAATVIYVDLEGDGRLLPNARRIASAEAAAGELGLVFKRVSLSLDSGVSGDSGDSGDPAAPGLSGEERAAEIRRLVKEKYPGWIEENGKDTLFFGGRREISEALLGEVANRWGFFWENPMPTPFLGYPAVLGLEIVPDATPAREGANADTAVDATADTPVDASGEAVRAKIAEKGLGDRIASGGRASSREIFLALGDLAAGALLEGKRPSPASFSDYFGVTDPGVKLSAYRDFVTGREIPKNILAFFDSSIIGAGKTELDSLDVPERLKTLRPLGFYDHNDFRVAIATNHPAQGEEYRLGAAEAIKRFGAAEEGGKILLSHFPENFMNDRQETADLIVAFAMDPLVKVILVNQGVPGTVDAFAAIRDLRPDILLVSAETHAEIKDIVKVADMAVLADFLMRSYLIPHTSKALGAESFLFLSFPRHMSSGVFKRLKAIMREASADLGLEFHEEDILDPLISGRENAIAHIRKSFPLWQEKYGKNTAFYLTNDVQNVAIIEGIVKTKEGYFAEGDIPSVLFGYPEAFGLEVGDDEDWRVFLDKVEEKVAEAGVRGRLGCWIYPNGFTETAGTVDFAVSVVKGESAIDDFNSYLNSLGKYTPGVEWSGNFYTDEVLGKPVKNMFLIFQDTYVLGKGPMSLRDVEVPVKYQLMGTALEPEKPRGLAPDSAVGDASGGAFPASAAPSRGSGGEFGR